jgi:predicted small lipoprotein YifL
VILIVKSILDLLLRVGAASSVLVLTGLLGACGQKGPLYLPAKPQPQPPAAATPAQVNPAPEQSATPASK